MRYCIPISYLVKYFVSQIILSFINRREILLDMGYTFGQFGSVVLAGFPPRSFCTVASTLPEQYVVEKSFI